MPRTTARRCQRCNIGAARGLHRYCKVCLALIAYEVRQDRTCAICKVQQDPGYDQSEIYLVRYDVNTPGMELACCGPCSEKVTAQINDTITGSKIRMGVAMTWEEKLRLMGAGDEDVWYVMEQLELQFAAWCHKQMLVNPMKHISQSSIASAKSRTFYRLARQRLGWTAAVKEMTPRDMRIKRPVDSGPVPEKPKVVRNNIGTCGMCEAPGKDIVRLIDDWPAEGCQTPLCKDCVGYFG